MFSIGTPELVVILGLALLLFGPKKLPEIGRSLGIAMRELRRASNDFMSAIEGSETDESRHDHKGFQEHFDDYEHERAKVIEAEAKPELKSDDKTETHQPKEGV